MLCSRRKRLMRTPLHNSVMSTNMDEERSNMPVSGDVHQACQRTYKTRASEPSQLQQFEYLTTIFFHSRLHRAFFWCYRRSLLAHDHPIPRHATHDHQRKLETISDGASNPPPTPITLILPGVTKCINHPTRAPHRTKTGTDDGIYHNTHPSISHAPKYPFSPISSHSHERA